jgi:hypothetical protein
MNESEGWSWIFEFSLSTSLMPILYPCAAQNAGERSNSTTMILAARDNHNTVFPTFNVEYPVNQKTSVNSKRNVTQ